jgi:hypothetical protein
MPFLRLKSTPLFPMLRWFGKVRLRLMLGLLRSRLRQKSCKLRVKILMPDAEGLLEYFEVAFVLF